MSVSGRPPGRDERADAVPAGETDGVEAFVAQRYVPMLRLARVLVGDLAQAEDLVQDVLATVVVRWRRVRAADDRVAYANRMLVNAATSWRRRPSRRESAAVLDDDRPAPDTRPATEARSALRAAMADLPRRHRAVLVLRYLEDWPDDDIADALGVAPATVRSCARRGLAALRGSGALDGYGPAPPVPVRLVHLEAAPRSPVGP